MLKFSQFIKESSIKPAVSLMGLAITPEEEQKYRAVIDANKDNPNTPEIEQGTDDPTWQNTNSAVSNYVSKEVQDMRRQAGL
jgi:hypothetical protein